MLRKALVAVVAATFIAATPAVAQEACKRTPVPKALPLADMVKMAFERARAWKPDATLASMSNTSLGFLMPDGTAASWHANFVSESANMFVSIDTANGFLTCYANPGKAGRIPDLKPEFFRDGAALYALAKQHGEALLAQGYGVSLGTAAAPQSRHATWKISFQKGDGTDGGIMVVVDANTGKVEQVIK